MAGNLNRLVLHNPYQVPKTEIDPGEAHFVGQRDTVGIASHWINEGTPVDKVAWDRYLDLKTRVKLGEFRGKDVSQLREQLATAEL